MSLHRPDTDPPLAGLARARFGGRTYPLEGITNVPATRIVLLPNNPNRVHWRVINEGATDVRISTSPDISAVSGWLLQNSGGQIEMDWEQDGEGVGLTVYAIGVAAGCDVRTYEVIVL